ncbi:FecR domain-containing protein [Butyricimonas sp.]|uniref:FecR family protein n=1 Tax=Butyricimonas sp. TaxID=1969738 RepID=UPI0025B7B67A|nr:FecR domain-containing protein [Butyricimonas sp.]
MDMNTQMTCTTIEERIQQIKRYLEGTLPAKDLEIFQRWMEESPANRKLVERIENEELLAFKIRYYENSHKTEDWQKVKRHLQGSKRMRFVTRYAIAATIGLLISVAVYLLYFTDVTLEAPLVAQQQPIMKGGSKAYLELATGEYITLDSNSHIPTRVDGAILKTDPKGMLVVEKEMQEDVDQEIKYHRIVVPQTGEYHVMLSDSSKIWLNSLSVLEFPVRFTGKERRVRLVAGEAYFEVTKNTRHPFIVEVENKEVRVLGTSFNINRYEQAFIATLVTGKVEVSTREKTYTLSPCMQLKEENGKVSLQKVDTREFTAWKDGWFVFKNQRLEEVLSTLARWYGIEVFYQKEKLKDLHFTGNIQRHIDISEVLQFLQKTGSVRFNLNQQMLIVSQ